MAAPWRLASAAKAVRVSTSQSIAVRLSRSFCARSARYRAMSARPAAWARRFAFANANSHASSNSAQGFFVWRTDDVIMPGQLVAPYDECNLSSPRLSIPKVKALSFQRRIGRRLLLCLWRCRRAAGYACASATRTGARRALTKSAKLAPAVWSC